MSRKNANDLITLLGKVVGPGLATIPVFGGALSASWSQWDTSRRFKRIESFIADMVQMLERLGRSFDPTNIGDAHMQLLEEVLRRVQIEHRENKRKHFAELIVSTWHENCKRPFKENMSFVRALDEFDDLHIDILHMLRSVDNEKYPTYVEIGDHLRILEQDRDRILIPALDRLASGYGFIKRAWGMQKQEGAVLFTQNLSPEGIARKCEHTLTETGSRFLVAILRDR